MTHTVRAFIAIPAAARTPLRELLGELAQLGRAVRPIAAEQLHVTVKFLGEIPLEAVAGLDKAVRQSIEAHPPSGHDLCGLGVFPHLQRPAVIWAGVTEPEPLVSLAASVDAGCASVGFPREQRPFHAHLTVARIKGRPPLSLRQFVQDNAERPLGPLNVDRLVLYRSEPGAGGSRYTPLATWPLADAPSR
jgi:2'-5' RNA ligase